MCVSAVSSGGDLAFSYFQSGRVRVRACRRPRAKILTRVLSQIAPRHPRKSPRWQDRRPRSRISRLVGLL